MMRLTNPTLLALVLLSSCQAREKAQISVSLAGVYKQTGLGLVSTTRVDITRMHYFLMAPDGSQALVDGGGLTTNGPARGPGDGPGSGNIGGSTPGGDPAGSIEVNPNVTSGPRLLILAHADVEPDPATLSFTIETLPGRNRSLGLLGGTMKNGKEELAYIGLVRDITLAPLTDNEVVVPFYPAGMLVTHFSLSAFDMQRVAATGYSGPLGCDLQLKRTAPLGDDPFEFRIFAPFEGFPRAELAAFDAQTIFGAGAMGLPTGDYTARCTMPKLDGGEIVLMDQAPFHIDQAAHTSLDRTLALPLGGLPGATGTTGPNGNLGRPPFYFEIKTSDDPIVFTDEPNIVSGAGALRKSQVGIQAKHFDGTLATEIAGDIMVRFHEVQPRAMFPNPSDYNVGRGGVSPVVPNGMQSGLANEYRMALGTQGRLLLPITSSASFLGLVEVVAVNPQTNTPEPHNMGMALFHISAGAPRCIPFPVDANALPDTITGVIPFVYPEGGQLGSNPNAAGRVGVDTHILFGFLAPEASGVRTCVLPGFQNNPTTNLNNYPGLTLSMPSIAGLPAIFAINQPGFTFAPFSVSPVEQVANIPLRHLDKGQRFVPNALRMSDALITQAQQSPGRAYLQMDISFTDQAMTQTLTLTSIGIDTGIGAAR